MPRSSNILGFIDGIQRGRLHGWALDRVNPGRRLLVAVRMSGRERTVLADRYRADLQQSGYGDGHYGFSVPVASDPMDAISAHVTSERPFVSLTPVRAARPVAHGHAAEAGSFMLQVDNVVRPRLLSGWAWNRALPNHRCVLQLFLDGSIRQTRRATLYRKELVAGGCDGYHGFHFPLPAGFSGRLRLRDIATGQLFEMNRHGVRCV